MCNQCSWLDEKDWGEKFNDLKMQTPPCRLITRIKKFRNELTPITRIWAILVLIGALTLVLFFQSRLDRRSLSLLSLASDDAPKTLQRFIEPEPDYPCPEIDRDEPSPKEVASLR